MSVDKFGRHEDSLLFKSKPGVKGPPGEGFHLTEDGDYDMKNKRLRNVGDPHLLRDSVNVSYLKKRCLMKLGNGDFDCGQKLIRNIGAPMLPNDAVTLEYVQDNTLSKSDDGNFDANNKVIRNLRTPIIKSDATTMEYVQSVIPSKTDEGDFDFKNKFIRNVGYPELINDAANVQFVKHELQLVTYDFESQLERLGTALFHYIHRHSGTIPPKDVNNRNYLDWSNIRGQKRSTESTE
jgi:hypothetical protein